jgi:CheY-like chemotaxis protein
MGPLILVVEDLPAIRELVRDALRLRGYQVALAGDGSEAIARLEVERPSLILLDINMRPMDGPAFVREAGRRGLLGDIPIIAWSGEYASAERAQELGARAYLQKPFTMAALYAEVARALSGDRHR